MTDNIVTLSEHEIGTVGGCAGFFETLGWIYDNPGQAIGKALDYGVRSASPKGYYANGVYNIK